MNVANRFLFLSAFRHHLFKYFSKPDESTHCNLVCMKLDTATRFCTNAHFVCCICSCRFGIENHVWNLGKVCTLCAGTLIVADKGPRILLSLVQAMHWNAAKYVTYNILSQTFTVDSSHLWPTCKTNWEINTLPRGSYIVWQTCLWQRCFSFQSCISHWSVRLWLVTVCTKLWYCCFAEFQLA